MLLSHLFLPPFPSELIQHYELPTISPAFRYQLILKFAVMSLIFAFAFPVLPLMGTVALIESYWSVMLRLCEVHFSFAATPKLGLTSAAFCASSGSLHRSVRPLLVSSCGSSCHRLHDIFFPKQITYCPNRSVEG